MVEENDDEKGKLTGPTEFFHENSLPRLNDLVEPEFLTDGTLIEVSPEFNGAKRRVWLCNENGERHPKSFELKGPILVTATKPLSELKFNPSKEKGKSLYCFVFDLRMVDNKTKFEYRDVLTTTIRRRNPYIYLETNEADLTPLNPSELREVLREKSGISFEKFLEIYEGKSDGSWGYKE